MPISTSAARAAKFDPDDPTSSDYWNVSGAETFPSGGKTDPAGTIRDAGRFHG